MSTTNYIDPRAIHAVERWLETKLFTSESKYTIRERTGLPIAEIEAAHAFLSRSSELENAIQDLRMKASQTIEENQLAFENRLRLAGWTQQDASQEWRRIQNDEEGNL